MLDLKYLSQGHYIGNFIRTHKGGVFSISLLSILVVAVDLFEPFFYRWVIDNLVVGEETSEQDRIQVLVYAAASFFLLKSFGYVADYLSWFCMAVLNHRLIAGLRRRLLARMTQLPIGVLRDMRVGGAVSRLNHDTALVGKILDRAVFFPASALIKMLVGLAAIVWLNWIMFVVAACVIVPLALVTRSVGNSLRPHFRRVNRQAELIGAKTTEIFSGIKILRLYGRAASEKLQYFRVYHKLIRAALRARRMQIVLESGWKFVGGTVQFVIVISGSFLVIKGMATVGDVFAIVLFAGMIIAPVNQIVQSYDLLQENVAAMERVDEILSLDVEDEGADLLPVPENVEQLELSNVSFRYPPSSVDSLNDLSLVIEANKTVALVGPSGAGKSTMVDVVLRFLAPRKGQVLLNGQCVNRLNLKNYRRLFGLVEQDVILFDGSIWDNIKYAHPRATDEAILDAAKQANVTEFVERMPKGFETQVGERGAGLSGGQRQRVGIARAILADAQILVLDEATSNLDHENETQIRGAIANLVKGRTVIIIAHRLSAVVSADMIVVLDGGRIIESGTHDQLMQIDGWYRKMQCDSQAEARGAQFYS